MSELSNMPERIWVRTEDGIHHITCWGKLTTHYNPTTDTEYVRQDLLHSSGWISVKERLRELIIQQDGYGMDGCKLCGSKWMRRPNTEKEHHEKTCILYPLPAIPKGDEK